MQQGSPFPSPRACGSEMLADGPLQEQGTFLPGEDGHWASAQRAGQAARPHGDGVWTLAELPRPGEDGS